LCQILHCVSDTSTIGDVTTRTKHVGYRDKIFYHTCSAISTPYNIIVEVVTYKAFYPMRVLSTAREGSIESGRSTKSNWLAHSALDAAFIVFISTNSIQILRLNRS
jgi:hypothetical protein